MKYSIAMSAYMALAEAKSSGTPAAAAAAINAADYDYGMEAVSVTYPEYGYEYGYEHHHGPDFEAELMALAKQLEQMKQALESNPEDFLDDIHREIMDAAEEGVEEIQREVEKAVYELDKWWGRETGSTLSGEPRCEFFFEEGHEGDYDWIAWNGINRSSTCAVGYDEWG